MNKTTKSSGTTTARAGAKTAAAKAEAAKAMKKAAAATRVLAAASSSSAKTGAGPGTGKKGKKRPNQKQRRKTKNQKLKQEEAMSSGDGGSESEKSGTEASEQEEEEEGEILQSDDDVGPGGDNQGRNGDGAGAATFKGARGKINIMTEKKQGSNKVKFNSPVESVKAISPIQRGTMVANSLNFDRDYDDLNASLRSSVASSGQQSSRRSSLGQTESEASGLSGANLNRSGRSSLRSGAGSSRNSSAGSVKEEEVVDPHIDAEDSEEDGINFNWAGMSKEKWNDLGLAYEPDNPFGLKVIGNNGKIGNDARYFVKNLLSLSGATVTTSFMSDSEEDQEVATGSGGGGNLINLDVKNSSVTPDHPLVSSPSVEISLPISTVSVAPVTISQIKRELP